MNENGCDIAKYCEYTDTCRRTDQAKCFQLVPLSGCGHPHACSRGRKISPSLHVVWCAMCAEQHGFATDEAVAEHLRQQNLVGSNWPGIELRELKWESGNSFPRVP